MTNKPTLKELLTRPVIREDACFKWMTKISQEELDEWESRAWEDIMADPDIEKLDRGSAMMARVIDREILYELLEIDEQHKQNELDKDNFE